MKNLLVGDVLKSMKTILLVENDTLINSLFKRILAEQGYQVICITSGEKALELFDQMKQKPAIVLVDFRLPQINGLELSEELRRRDPKLKILMITGDPQVDLGKAHEIGIKVKKKPVSKTELITEIQLLLNGSFLSTTDVQNLTKSESLLAAKRSKNILDKYSLF